MSDNSYGQNMRDEFKNTENWVKLFLSHYNADEKLQVITYRLADSLPQNIIKTLGAPHSDAGLSNSDSEAKRRIKIEKLLDQIFGSCLLKYPDVAEKVITTWKFNHGKLYDLIAYVVMPNHVHVLIKTKTRSDLGKIVWPWKSLCQLTSLVFLNMFPC